MGTSEREDWTKWTEQEYEEKVDAYLRENPPQRAANEKADDHIEDPSEWAARGYGEKVEAFMKNPTWRKAHEVEGIPLWLANLRLAAILIVLGSLVLGLILLLASLIAGG